MLGDGTRRRESAKMHYLVFVFTPDGDESKIPEMLEHYEYTHWDWYVIGGRYGDVLSSTTAPVKELPPNILPYAFVTEEHGWIAKEIYFSYPHSMTFEEAEAKGFGFQPNKSYEPCLKEAMEQYKDGFITIVDCHN